MAIGEQTEVSDLTVVSAMSPNVYWKQASNNFLITPEEVFAMLVSKDNFLFTCPKQ